MMIGKSPINRSVIFAALLLAWMSIWGTWIPHQTAALTQQGLDFAEWSTFLPDVRSGDLPHYPDLLRAAFGLCTVALCLNSRYSERAWLRWSPHLAGFFTGILLLPPYPGGFSLAIFSFWWSGYPYQFIAALLTISLCLVSAMTMKREDRWIGLTSLVTILPSLTLGWLAYTGLKRPFEAHYAHHLSPGWGTIFFFSGLLTAMLLQILLLTAFKNKTGQISDPNFTE